MKDNLLGISWHDSAWIPVLNSGNVIDYFSERSNPFYDRTCNNEIVKMQRLSPEQLMNMTGLEYILLHVQEPILYVIRKQHRHSATQATPISDYYIIAGVVYQAPDLSSVVNSRLLSTINHMQSAFDEILSYSRYHPSKGYTWEFKEKDVANKLEKKKEKKEEPSSLFQRQRVDMLLVELSKKFPLRTYVPQSQIQGQPDTPTSNKPATPAGNEDSSKPDSNNPGGGGTSNAVIKTEPQDIKPSMQQLQQQQNQDKPDSFNNSGGGNAMPSNNTNNLQQTTQNQQRMKPPPEKRARMS